MRGTRTRNTNEKECRRAAAAKKNAVCRSNGVIKYHLFWTHANIQWASINAIKMGLQRTSSVWFRSFKGSSSMHELDVCIRNNLAISRQMVFLSLIGRVRFIGLTWHANFPWYHCGDPTNERYIRGSFGWISFKITWLGARNSKVNQIVFFLAS